MRINKFLAQFGNLSRRAADTAISDGRVLVNGRPPEMGQQISETDIVSLDGRAITPDVKTQTIVLNKPIGYVCSRNGQGSSTVYDLLPSDLHQLKPVGRLDKNSSGLLLLTNDGQLAYELTHPSFQKLKIYEITLDKQLEPLHQQMINDYGVTLEDGPSKLQLERRDESRAKWRVLMREGRNRQIRRTFSALGYEVIGLHRTNFGNYNLGELKPGVYQPAKNR